jgi:predicted outer membrane repeat protein
MRQEGDMVKHKLLHVLLLFMLVFGFGLNPVAGQNSQESGNLIYVDIEATGANDGSSWENAYTDLEAALNSTVTGDQIWVAAGTYLPSVEKCGTGDSRYKAFQLKNQVALYGGFDPSVGDDSLEERDWVGNETILSGDLGIPGDNADNSYHVFCHPAELNLDSSAVMDGFIVQDGNANGSAPDDSGGGMLNNTSSPTLTHVTFQNNSASQGGGMLNNTSSPTLTHVTFQNNSASQVGGGLYNGFSSSPNLTHVTFQDNLAGGGGGMDNSWDGNPTLTNVIFSNNTAIYSGGGMLNGSDATLTNVTFSNNTAPYGGGMYSDTEFDQPSLMNVTFINNSATYGGGLYTSGFDFGAITLTNVTFSSNSATYGGGVYSNYDYGSHLLPTLSFCTFTKNSATHGGGMYNVFELPGITNSILWGDTPDEIYNEYFYGYASYSDVWTADGSVYTGTGNLNADPLLGILGDYGGFVQTHPIPSGSPVIDAANPDPARCPSTDACGNPRPVDGNGDGTPRCDMGAYENQLVPGFSRVFFLPIVVK